MPRTSLCPPILLATLLFCASGSSATSADDGTWTEVRQPPPRSLAAAAFDPIREQLVMFGGFLPAGVSQEVWTCSLQSRSWTLRTVQGPSPPGRRDHTLVYDSIADRFILFGGWDRSAFLDDLWVLSLQGGARWERLEVPGSKPSPRSEHGTLFDPIRNRMIVVGGHGPEGRASDVWQLDLSGVPAWSRMETATVGPANRHSHTFTYDPVRDRAWVIGGWEDGPLSDAWYLPLGGPADWAQISPNGSLPPRKDHVTVYDELRDRIIVSMGANDSLLSDTWILDPRDGGAWSEIVAERPPPRRDAVAIYDTPRARVLLFGGWSGDVRRDVWALEGGASPTWSWLPPRTSPSLGSDLAIADVASDRAIHLGGAGWTISLSDFYDVAPIDGENAPPGNLQDMSAVFDPEGRRVLVFGGSTTVDGTFDRLWQLSLDGPPRWAELFPEGPAPPDRTGHFAALDAPNRRMIVVGGVRDNYSEYLDDVWSLMLEPPLRWIRLHPEGTGPGHRRAGSAVYDPDYRRMILFGGTIPVPPYGIELKNDLWALRLEEPVLWERLAPAGQAPLARWGNSTVYDSKRGRMVLYGGRKDWGTDPLSDVWALSLRDSLTWMRLQPSGEQASSWFQAAVYDPLRDRMVAYMSGDWMRALQWETEPPPPNGRVTLQLGVPYPNPSGGPTTLDLSLNRESKVRAEIHDIFGRLVRVILDERIPAGDRTLVWDGRAASNRVVPAGLYFARVAIDGVAYSRKVLRW